MQPKRHHIILKNGHSEKQINQLSKPAEKAKEAVTTKLKKSLERFRAETKGEKTQSKNAQALKKLKRVEADLKILKGLSVDSIVKYALSSTDKNLMAIAANKRLPHDVRMKARIASHKPLSTHLSLLRSKQQDSDNTDDSDQEEKEEEDEEEEPKNENGVQLDKITLNNQIVLMRKDTKRAIVHTINKLTKTIKKLRSSKATGDKKSMLEAKTEKMVKKIKYIKECEVDEISRFALSNTLPAQKILSDSKMPLKSQAMATVIINKFIQNKVDEFKKSFPDYMKNIQTLLKQKKKKKRKLDIQNKNEMKTLKRKSTESSNSDSENDDVNDTEDGDSQAENSSEDGDGVNNDNLSIEDTCQSKFAKEESEEESVCEEKSDGEEDGLQSNSSEVESGEELPEKCQIKHTAGNTVPKISALREKTFQIQPSSGQPLRDQSTSSQKRLKLQPTKSQPKVVDPFFVTTTNEEYITSQVPVESFDNGNKSRWNTKNDDHIPIKGKSFSNLQSSNRWNNKEEGAKWSKNRDFGGSNLFKKQFSNSFEKASTNERRPLGHLGNRKERRKALQQPVMEVKPEKLHPSWEAKKKTLSIASFQGKKITFD